MLILAGAQLFQNQRLARRLASDIQARDSQGKATSVQLAQLRLHARTHMNAGAEVFLAGSYNRDTAKAQEQAKTSSDGAIYQRAQAACGKGSSIEQANCVAAYIASNSSPGKNPVIPRLPESGEYEHKFRSPVWTPDLAGALLMGSLVTAGIAAASLYKSTTKV